MSDTNPIIRDRFGNSTGRTLVSDAHAKRARKTYMPRKYKGGPRFSRVGFFVEGIYFPPSDLGMECASAYGAKLARQYDRPVEIRVCLLPGAASLAFLRVPHDSADALVARTDAHGYVITGQGQTIMGVR
jgi:hypothetical protein